MVGRQPSARSHFPPLPPARAGQGSWDGFIIYSGSSTPVCVPLQPYVLPIPVCWSVNKGRIIHHHQAKKGKAGDLHLKSFRFTATSGERLRHPSGACVRVIGVTWRLIGREATSRLPTCLSGSTTKGCLIESSRVTRRTDTRRPLDRTPLLLLLFSLLTT